MLLTLQNIILIFLISSTTVLRSQVMIDSTHIVGSFKNSEDCWVTEFNYSIPHFRSGHQNTERILNDSVIRYFNRDEYMIPAELNKDSLLSLTGNHFFIEKDSAFDSLCGSFYLPEESNSDFNLFINDKNLLSFSLEGGGHAGGGGNGFYSYSHPFVFDLTRKCWLNKDSLFNGQIDTLLKHAADSLGMNEGYPEYFTGEVELRKGQINFLYAIDYGRGGGMDHISFSYPEIEQYIRIPYRKLLKSLE